MNGVERSGKRRAVVLEEGRVTQGQENVVFLFIYFLAYFLLGKPLAAFMKPDGIEPV